MLAYREWRVRLLADDLRPVLFSTCIDAIWLEPELEADQEPETDLSRGLGKLHGVHAVTPDYPRSRTSTLYLMSGPPPWSDAWAVGAVELSGTIVEHEDGVLRASRARILALRFVPTRHACPEPDCRIWRLIRPHVGVLPLPAPSKRTGPLVRTWLLSRPCSKDWHWRPEPEPEPEREQETQSRGDSRAWECSPEELERMLLQRYEVPRLPDDAGPWPRLWSEQKAP